MSKPKKRLTAFERGFYAGYGFLGAQVADFHADILADALDQHGITRRDFVEAGIDEGDLEAMRGAFSGDDLQENPHA